MRSTQKESFEKVKHFLNQQIGFDYGEKRDKELLAKLEKASRDFKFTSVTNFIEWLPDAQLSPNQLMMLASSLTVGETYFFREKNVLDYLEKEYLPDLIKKRAGSKTIKIWSAGCASGEEAYTIAIILKRLIPFKENWNIKILATDINPDFLDRAKQGIFSQWSFRKTDASFKKNHFTPLDQRNYQIKKEYREMVSFFPLNLVTNCYPSPVNDIQDMDVILCRNVLIYFTPDKIREVSERLVKTLNSNGVLLVSPVETALISTKKLQRLVYKDNTVFYPGATTDPKQEKNPHTLFAKHLKAVSAAAATKNNIEIPLPESKISRKERNNIISKGLSISSPENTPQEISQEDIRKLYQLGKLEEAENALKSNKKNKKNSTSMDLLHAKIMADTLRFEQAKTICKKIIESNKTKLSAYYLLGTIYWEEENIPKAKQAFETVLFLDPDYVMAHVFLAYIYRKKGDTKTGLKHLRIATEILNSRYAPQDIILESDGMSSEDLILYIDQIQQGMTVEMNVF